MPDTDTLRRHLENLTGARSWWELAVLGVELVDHPAHIAGTVHLAVGTALRPTGDGWDVITDACTGVTVTSGGWTRLHTPGVDERARIHPTATIDPTARIEAGAVIAARTTIGRHAHIGRAAHLGPVCRIEPGAYLGPGTIARAGVRVGRGAVIGTGSCLGGTRMISDGLRLAQRNVFGPYNTPTDVLSRSRRDDDVAHSNNLIGQLRRTDHR